MPENGFKPVRPEDRNSFQHMGDIFKKGINVVRSRPVLLSVLGIGFIYGLYSEGWDRLWVKYLVDNFTLPSLFGMNEVAFFGLLRAGGMLLSILATRQVEKRLDANHAPSIARAMLWITVLLSGAILTFAFSPALAISILAVTAVSILRNVMGPLYSAWVNQRLDSEVARHRALHVQPGGRDRPGPKWTCCGGHQPGFRPGRDHHGKPSAPAGRPVDQPGQPSACRRR